MACRDGRTDNQGPEDGHVRAHRAASPHGGERIHAVSGERVVEGGYTFGKDGALRELTMYKDQTPDFRNKEWEIFPSGVPYWHGTTPDGQIVRGQEGDIFRTDGNCNVVRLEYSCETRQFLTKTTANCKPHRSTIVAGGGGT